ncbi:hypothetical protein GCM10027057_06740 [Marisediminicola antarctica]
MRNFLRVRDETCRFPGCSRQAEQCDIDHTLQWQHQHPTAHYNLAHLCPKHHTIKDETNWTVAHTRDGTGALEWTSPAGRTHITEPATVITSGVHDNLQRALHTAARDQGTDQIADEAARAQRTDARRADARGADAQRADARGADAEHEDPPPF